VGSEDEPVSQHQVGPQADDSPEGFADEVCGREDRVADEGADDARHNPDPERLPERGHDKDDGKAIEGDHEVRYDGAGIRRDMYLTMAPTARSMPTIAISLDFMVSRLWILTGYPVLLGAGRGGSVQ